MLGMMSDQSSDIMLLLPLAAGCFRYSANHRGIAGVVHNLAVHYQCLLHGELSVRLMIDVSCESGGGGGGGKECG